MHLYLQSWMIIHIWNMNLNTTNVHNCTLICMLHICKYARAYGITQSCTHKLSTCIDLISGMIIICVWNCLIWMLNNTENDRRSELQRTQHWEAIEKGDQFVHSPFLFEIWPSHSSCTLRYIFTKLLYAAPEVNYAHI